LSDITTSHAPHLVILIALINHRITAALDISVVYCQAEPAMLERGLENEQIPCT